MKLFPIILIGIILEILVWVGVAQFISGWYVFFWFIIAFVIGLSLLRSSTATIMPQLQQMQMTGQMSADGSVTKKLAIAFAGILLMIPGLITDVLALLVMLPPVQKMIQNAGMKFMAKKQQAMMNNMMGGMMGNMGDMGGAQGQNPFADLMRQMQDMQNQQSGGQSRNSTIIDGEAHEVEPERKQIELKDVNQK
ncbi:FxsA family protein [uncultured Acinetobacter sp.]|uniref:FxsA family protein n=1 Tax=uncultured Acinetobacter sp. TaxID=165433 RepID=UPI0025E58347|nr:FxsA family protein [uncultured Acinetobacter sp.]